MFIERKRKCKKVNLAEERRRKNMETYYFQAYVCSEGSIGGILIFDCEVTKEQAETLASAQNIGKKLKEMEFKDNLYLKIMEEAAKQAGPVYSSREFLQKKTEKAALLQATEYYKAITNSDISRVDNVKRDA